jgi:hypothetical protein
MPRAKVKSPPLTLVPPPLPPIDPARQMMDDLAKNIGREAIGDVPLPEKVAALKTLQAYYESRSRDSGAAGAVNMFDTYRDKMNAAEE